MAAILYCILTAIKLWTFNYTGKPLLHLISWFWFVKKQWSWRQCTHGERRTQKRFGSSRVQPVTCRLHCDWLPHPGAEVSEDLRSNSTMMFDTSRRVNGSQNSFLYYCRNVFQFFKHLLDIHNYFISSNYFMMNFILFLFFTSCISRAI